MYTIPYTNRPFRSDMRMGHVLYALTKQNL
jgi:hypothetical protein